MHSRRTWVVGVAVVLTILMAACKPVQLDIDFTLRRSGKISKPDANGHRQMTLSGVLACSGGTTSNVEHLDLFVSAVQNGISMSVDDGYDHCQNEPKVWTHAWDVVVPPGIDLAQPVEISIYACTNPGELIDEDCEQVTEGVEFIIVN